MPDLTVFCPFTRLWAVRPFFDALLASDVPREARFVGFVDSNEPGLAEVVSARAAGFAEVKIVRSGRAAPYDGSPRIRRPRHALMREASRSLVGDGPLLLLLEDDTLIPADAFARLSETKALCDWAIGAEVGRWGRHRPPGVWKFQLHKGRPVRKEALMPGRVKVEEADATGFYCVLTEGSVYRSMEFLTWNETLGHDVHCTWRLKQAGYRLMVDWRVECVHMGQDGPVYVREATPYSVGLPGNVDIRLRRVEVGEQRKGVLRYPIAIGVDCELEGRHYPKGTRVDHETALALKATGQLKDERIQ
jgi:hypothetical protein